MSRSRRAALIAAGVLAGCAGVEEARLPVKVRGDAIPAPLVSHVGDPARGYEIVIGREANCMLCHSIPDARQRFMGNLGPPLAGVGSRLSAGQLRLRLVDPTLVNREAVMPAYYRVHELNEVATSFRGRTVLTAEQIEDVVSFLLTLK